MIGYNTKLKTLNKMLKPDYIIEQNKDELVIYRIFDDKGQKFNEIQGVFYKKKDLLEYLIEQNLFQ